MCAVNITRIMDFRGTYKGGGGPDKTVLNSAAQHDPARVYLVVVYIKQPDDHEFQIPEMARKIGVKNFIALSRIAACVIGNALRSSSRSFVSMTCGLFMPMTIKPCCMPGCSDLWCRTSGSCIPAIPTPFIHVRSFRVSRNISHSRSVRKFRFS